MSKSIMEHRFSDAHLTPYSASDEFIEIQVENCGVVDYAEFTKRDIIAIAKHFNLTAENKMITEIKVGDYIEKSELDTEQKYNDVVEVFEQWGFEWGDGATENYRYLNDYDCLVICKDGLWQSSSDRYKKRKLTYNDIMRLKKVDVDNCNVDKLVSGGKVDVSSGPFKSADTTEKIIFDDHFKPKLNKVSTVNRDLEGQMAGKKFDGDKLRFSLIPPQPLSDVNKVLEFGAKKYGANSWQKVDNAQERYFNAAMRHLLAWQSGELVDDESGLPHLAHAQCCLMFMMHFDVEAKEVK